MHRLPRAPIHIDPVLEDPGLIRRLVERHAPYYPVQRYFSNAAEYRASSGGGDMIIAPNFRGDWAYDAPLVEGVEPLLHHEGFRKAAGELFGTPHVRPQIVYSNITWQLPFAQGGGHTDVPAFRGVDRTQVPIWLLGAMGHSGLFEDERIRIATAVAWFYRGSDGGFEYWPDGPEAPPRVHEGEIFNTAIMGDNDCMYHRVRPVGRKRDGLLADMTLDTKLCHAGGEAWEILDGDERRAAVSYDALRISVSWKAQVFRDEDERRMVDDHTHDIDLATVFDRFAADFRGRGVHLCVPDDPLHDPDLVELLSTTYVREPTVFA